VTEISRKLASLTYPEAFALEIKNGVCEEEVLYLKENLAESEGFGSSSRLCANLTSRKQDG
jgi:hypothetical protein